MAYSPAGYGFLPDIDGFIRVCMMAPYGSIWLCMAYMALYGYIWLYLAYMAPYGCIWLYMAYIAPYGSMYGLYGSIWL